MRPKRSNFDKALCPDGPLSRATLAMARQRHDTPRSFTLSSIFHGARRRCAATESTVASLFRTASSCDNEAIRIDPADTDADDEVMARSVLTFVRRSGVRSLSRSLSLGAGGGCLTWHSVGERESARTHATAGNKREDLPAYEHGRMCGNRMQSGVPPCTRAYKRAAAVPAFAAAAPMRIESKHALRGRLLECIVSC